MTAHASPALGTAARRRARTGARLVALTLAAVAPPAVPAAAQIAPGTSGRSSTLVFNDAGEAWRTLVAFGNCYADRNTEQALALVAADPGSNGEAQTYRRMFSRDNQSCLGGSTELRMPLAMVRGAIVEGLYRRGIALPEALRQPPLAADAEVRTLSEAARCYTAAHRGEVEALVADSRAGSRDEYERLSAMAPDFFRCVPATAQGRRFETTLIRYRLVEALLRMPAAQSAAAAER